jgi:hypothetical protein
MVIFMAGPAGFVTVRCRGATRRLNVVEQMGCQLLRGGSRTAAAVQAAAHGAFPL